MLNTTGSGFSLFDKTIVFFGTDKTKRKINQ